MRKKKLLAGLAAALPAFASAQEDAVVVSATRAPRPSLEVPASVDRIYAEEIREGRPQVNLSESLGRVPGITVQNRHNYAQDLQISSRGFGARSTFGVRGIRLIADGVPATMPDGQGQAATFSLSSAERIEVLRGPFSSLYGNAAGGVILVETEDGPDPPVGEARMWVGSYDSWRAGLKLGGQFGRLNAIADLSRFETDGYRQHSAARRDHLNTKFRVAWSEATSVTLVANSLRQPDSQDPGGLNRAQYDQDPRQVAPQVLTSDARKTVLQDQVGVTLRHRVSPVTRIEATAYGGERWVEQYLAIPLSTQLMFATHSGGVVNLDRGYGGTGLRFFTEFGAVRVSLGAEYELMKERRKGFLNVNGVSGDLRRDEDNDVATTGLYTQAEWQFAPRWTAHAGVRTSRVRFRSEDFFVSNGDDSGAKSYRATTPVAGILFRVARDTSIYANVGRGFETPTFVELAHRGGGLSGLNFDLEASKSRHAEVGVKTLAARWLRVNAAVFDVATKNEIVVEQNTGGRATFKNAGRTERRGLEMSAETLFGGAVEARAAYTVLDATFRDSFTTVTGTPAVPITVPAGSYLPGVPRTQFYAELRYRREWFYTQLEALRRSRVPVNDQNSEFADAFSVLNWMGGFVQERGRWRFTEFVRIDNLTDRKYAGSVIVNDGNRRYYEPSPRRNYLIGVQARLEL